MSHRLQVLISPELDSQIEKAAQRSRVSKGEWVRRALHASLRDAELNRTDALDLLQSLNAPTADIDEMIAQIESGRR
jgi:hypothetical protein